MSEAPKDNTGSQIGRDELHRIREEAALWIDPETAETIWAYAQTLDPYGDGLELDDEARQIGREYFARAPGSDIWVWFGDLPTRTRERLWNMHKSELAFPAGLW